MTKSAAVDIGCDHTIAHGGYLWATNGYAAFLSSCVVGARRYDLDARVGEIIGGASPTVATMGQTYTQNRGPLGVLRYRDMSGILYRARYLEAAEEAWPDLVWYAPTKLAYFRGTALSFAAARIGSFWLAFVAPTIVKPGECIP